MKLYIRIIATFLLVISCFAVKSQYYNVGQDAPSIKWRQLKTEHIQLIYPDYFEEQAQELANTFESACSKVGFSLSHTNFKIPVIAHPETMEPNAFVAWAPKRMELYTTTPAVTYAQDWLTQLVLHETRHVVQIDRANKDIVKFLSFLFGQQAVIGAVGLYVPNWFMEGDAVVSETVLSNSGRGRLAEFEMPLRAQLLTKKVYRYNKATMGSFKDFVPNHYELGYQLVTYGRKKYGPRLWTNALDNVSERFFMITPFNRGIKEVSGVSKRILYKNAMKELSENWSKQDSLTKITEYKIVSRQKYKYQNFHFPKYIDSNNYVALSTSPDAIPAFVSTQKQSDYKKIHETGYLLNNNFDLKINDKNETLVTWTEWTTDKRYDMRTFTDIWVMKLESGKAEKITQKGRWQSPCISPDGKYIAAVYADKTNNSYLIKLDISNGNIIDTIIKSDKFSIHTPSWGNDNKIAVILLSKHGKQLSVIDLEAKNLTEIIPFGFEEISFPSFAGNFILYNSDISGIQNVFAIDINSKEKFQVTSSRFGAINACISPDYKRIVYSDYTSDGYRIVETDFDMEKFIPIERVENHNIKTYEALFLDEAEPVVEIEQKTHYKSKKYSKLSNFINIHSWMPSYNTTNPENSFPGITLMSQNNLNTTIASVSAAYNYNKAKMQYKASVEYLGLYPIIGLAVEHLPANADSINEFPYKNLNTANETSAGVYVKVPFKRISGKHIFNASLVTQTNFVAFRNKNFENQVLNIVDNENILHQKFIVEGSHLIRMSQKDFQPRFAQIIRIGANMPIISNLVTQVYGLTLKGFFPGIANHHGVSVELNSQISTGLNANKIYFPIVRMPFGYKLEFYDQLYFANISYKMPIAYPDASLGSIFYLKRIKGGPYGEAGFATRNNIEQNLNSLGFEASLDFHILRFPIMFELGIRYGYFPDKKSTYKNILLSTKL